MSESTWMKRGSSRVLRFLSHPQSEKVSLFLCCGSSSMGVAYLSIFHQRDAPSPKPSQRSLALSSAKEGYNFHVRSPPCIFSLTLLTFPLAQRYGRKRKQMRPRNVAERLFNCGRKDRGRRRRPRDVKILLTSSSPFDGEGARQITN